MIVEPWVFQLCIVALATSCQAPKSTAPATPAKPTAPAESSLIGTSWLYEDIGGRAVLDRVRSELTFGNETSLEGSTGCNRYFAGLQLSGTTIHIGNTGSTKMACPSAVMDQETRFLVALEAAKAYRLNRNANQLWLLGENGSELAHFARIGGAAGSTGRTSGGTESSQVPRSPLLRKWPT
jgi:heat shock protein HslJ